jgi:hypothetical protein
MKHQLKSILILFLLLTCVSVVTAQWKEFNRTIQAPGGFYTNEQINALVAAAISGSGTPNLLDAIFGTGTLFEKTVGPNIPKLVGAGVLDVDSTGRAPSVSLLTYQDSKITKLADKNRGQVYENGQTTTRSNLGIFNVQDFQARDNDSTDNVAAIQAAIDAARAEGGGVVRLSFGTSGIYRISAPLIYKQGVVIEGEISAQGAKVRLKLTSNNSNAITVGENLTSVTIRNLEIFTEGTSNSKGILFTGSYPTATQIVTLESLTINGFTRGISVEAKDGSRQWQMSYVTARNLVLHNCLYGIYLDAINSDWNVDNLVTYIRKDGYGVYVANIGTLQFNHPNFLGGETGGACTGGVPNPTYGEAVIKIDGHHSAITVINGQQEGFRKTLVQNREDWTYPITFINTVMGAPIELNEDTLFVSIGNFYYDNTVRAKGDTRIYSMGDSISPLNTCLDPGTGIGGFSVSGGAFIVKRESAFGTDYQLPVSINAAAPRAVTGNPNNPAMPLLNIGSANTGHIFMRLGQTDAVTRAFTSNYFDISRDHDGLLNFFGSQPMPYTGIKTNGTIKALHYEGLGPAPTITSGPSVAVGTGATVSITGTDAAFEVTLTTGTGAKSAGTLLTVTFSTPYTAAPYEVFSASSSESAGLATRGVGVYSTSTTTNVVLASTAAVSDARVYKFKFQIKQ